MHAYEASQLYYEMPVTAKVSFDPALSLAEVEREVIVETLRRLRYNRTRAARALGIGIRTLQRKIKEYRVSHPELVLSAEN